LFSSVVITKLDGHAKGGGALSAVAATNSPIVFIGTGERIPDIEPFSSHSFVRRLLGMGNIEQLVETVKDAVSVADQKKLQEKFVKGKLTLRDFQEQIQTAMKMGPIENLIQMFPGFSNLELPKGGALFIFNLFLYFYFY
jgi:signal recognition particle subunit SRP54